ncbi:hypothetical protein PV797_06940 [Clostridiaceae bacterium M8S5]|nr:hypothetical protein PV797_06940 [Clostridiaceae bacterium M8S5]
MNNKKLMSFLLVVVILASFNTGAFAIDIMNENNNLQQVVTRTTDTYLICGSNAILWSKPIWEAGCSRIGVLIGGEIVYNWDEKNGPYIKVFSLSLGAGWVHEAFLIPLS